jgi:hypothetical protein
VSLIDRTRGALARAIEVYRGTGHDARLVALRARLDEPLRVAIAGRVKSGKSTLLNALVGERLAPTDAGECTRIVTWYQDGHTYQVLAQPRMGAAQQLRFAREHEAIEVDLAGLDPANIERLLVTWPSQALRTATLIDTPGIGSLSEQVSRRAWELLAPASAREERSVARPRSLRAVPGDASAREERSVARPRSLRAVPGDASAREEPSGARPRSLRAVPGDEDDEETPADAVIYLMRQLHVGDVEFLQAFHDAEVSKPNPVNAIGVLSRADEVGVGRVDAMASARRVAARMAADVNVRRVVQTVVPVAGLLAETAVTLTEAEVASLRRVAEVEVTAAEELLLTADRFVDRMPELGLTSLEREALLRRFGLFGIRLATSMLRRDSGLTASELARDLADRSGVGELRDVLSSLFFQRRDVLKSRSSLLALDTLVRTVPRPGGEAIAAEVEEIVASAHPFNELRVLSAVRAGWVSGKPDVVEDLECLIGGAGVAPAVRLRLPLDAGPAELVAAAGEALARWQRRAENPLTAHEMVIAARVAIRSCEGLLAELNRPQ